MKTRWILLLALGFLAGLSLAVPDAALAGPGGQIVSAAFRTPLGRVLLAILVVLLSPWIIYCYVREQIAVRRSLRDLQVLVKVSDELYGRLSGRAPVGQGGRGQEGLHERKHDLDVPPRERALAGGQHRG